MMYLLRKFEWVPAIAVALALAVTVEAEAEGYYDDFVLEFECSAIEMSSNELLEHKPQSATVALLHTIQNNDADNDGLLSRREAENIPMLDNAFYVIDSDTNDRLTPTEVGSWLYQQAKDRLDAHFATVDTNRDGHIDFDEAAVGDITPSEFIRLDSNQDEQVSADEIWLHWTQTVSADIDAQS